MSDLHIDDFYRDAAKILVQLYRYFPRPTMILAEEISGPDTPDEYGLPSDRHQACFGAILWLARSGYLEYQDTIRQEGVDQASLSHSAFTLLSAPSQRTESEESSSQSEDNSIPASVAKARNSNIHHLRMALQSDNSTQIGERMMMIMQQFEQSL